MKIHAKHTLKVSRGKIVEVKKAEVLGYGMEEILGKDVVEYLDPTTAEGLEKGGRVVLLDANGKPHEFEAVVGDETLLFDIRDMADAIRAAYKPVWDFHYGFVFLSEDGIVITCNQTFYTHSGFKPEEVEGRVAWDAFGEWVKQIFPQLVSGHDVDAEFGNRSFRLRPRFIEFYNRKILGGSGKNDGRGKAEKF